MRVDVARALALKQDLIVFDEFTSVVDREVAKVSAFAVSKAIRKADKRFIAVTCHYDVVDWLEPDWVFTTDTMEFTKKKDAAHRLSLTCTSATQKFGEYLGSIII